MKKELQKKFYAFLPVGIAFIIVMFSTVSAKAQIVYTDIIPDTVLGNPGNYNLDLNNDGQTDFTFHGQKDTLHCGPGACYGLVTNVTLSPTALSWVSDAINIQARKLNSGDSICSSSPLWTNTPNQAMYIKTGICGGQCGNFPSAKYFYTGVTAGLWNNVADNYLALKIQVAGSIYYGWARLDVGNNGWPVTIKDYAYNIIPNQTILAGQTIATGIIENSFAASINLYPNPATNHLTIDLPNANEKVKLTITDIAGKIIYKTAAFAALNIEVNTEDFAAGIYAVQIQSADFIATKKLIIQK